MKLNKGRSQRIAEARRIKDLICLGFAIGGRGQGPSLAGSEERVFYRRYLARKVELESVRSLLEKQRWQVETYTGAEALEETIEHVEHPHILHVATHGLLPSRPRPVTGRPGR